MTRFTKRVFHTQSSDLLTLMKKIHFGMTYCIDLKIWLKHEVILHINEVVTG